MYTWRVYVYSNFLRLKIYIYWAEARLLLVYISSRDSVPKGAALSWSGQVGQERKVEVFLSGEKELQ